MKKIYLVLALITLFSVCLSFTACFGILGNNDITIEDEYLVADHTCYIGNYHCPKLYVKVKNNSSSTYSVWVDVNFYYKNELASSKSSPLQILSDGDTYTFVIQSSVGTNIIMDADNWTYKITNIQSNKK